MSSLNGRELAAVTATTADVTLTSTDHATWRSNVGATAAVTCTLPAATVGLRYGFIVGATFAFVAKPAGTDKIGLPNTGVPGTSGLGIQSLIIGNIVELACLVAGSWAPTVGAGSTTWTTT